jgi:hypothetical protein
MNFTPSFLIVAVVLVGLVSVHGFQPLSVHDRRVASLFQRGRNTALHGWLDFNPFKGSGSGGNKEFLDEQWEAQQAILRARQGVFDKEHLKEKYAKQAAAKEAGMEVKKETPAKTPMASSSSSSSSSTTTVSKATTSAATKTEKKPAGAMFFATDSATPPAKEAAKPPTAATTKSAPAQKNKPMFKMPWDK